MIFCKKKIFLIFEKVPKKAPGYRIANFLNLNQCTIKYQNCKKKVQGSKGPRYLKLSFKYELDSKEGPSCYISKLPKKGSRKTN